MSLVRVHFFSALVLLMVTLASCRSGPSRVQQPEIDPTSAGSQAMEQYDTNGDGVVAGAELEKSPALKAAIARLDTNGDKGVSAEEVAARVEAWQAMSTGLTSFAFTVTLDGRPLPQAAVTFEPEQFLGDEIESATATTNQSGSGRASIPKDRRPDASWPSGIQFGLYRVKVSQLVNGKELIPAKYNSETTLGQEVANDVSEIANNRVVYTLTSK